MKPQLTLFLMILLSAAGLGVGSPAFEEGTASPKYGFAKISGLVADAETGQGIADAVVRLGIEQAGPVSEPLRTLTDSGGRFTFARVPASVSKRRPA